MSARNDRHCAKTVGKGKRKDAPTRNGLVVATYGRSCRVALEGELVTCLPRQEAGRNAVLPVAGDSVVVAKMSGNANVITEIRPRRTVLARADPHLPEEKVIAANADLVVVVVSVVTPPLHPRLIDRCLVAAGRGGLEAAICVNKVDLLQAEALERELAVLGPYKEMGIPVLPCSAQGGVGLDALSALLRGKTSVLLGHSGVGKSSLVNALDPSIQRQIGAVRRKDGKGRHTTTVATLVHLDCGAAVIDTPGFREFALFGVSAGELQQYFPEFAPYADDCVFTDCTHLNEPGCQVKAGVRKGGIFRLRYESYRKLLVGDDSAEPPSGNPDRQGDHDEHSFQCVHCGALVIPEGAGTSHRNHCPHCLWSLHLDIRPGDRAAYCEGHMEPVAIWVRRGDEWALIHRCRECGTFASNRIAADDNELLLLSLAVKPLATPPFPLDRAGLGVLDTSETRDARH